MIGNYRPSEAPPSGLHSKTSPLLRSFPPKPLHTSRQFKSILGLFLFHFDPMYTQLSIEDPPIYETVPEVLARVERNASCEWKQAAERIVRDLCRTMASFTSDFVLAELDKQGIYTHENRALGAVMKNACRDGLCEPTGTYLPSTRPQSHKRPQMLWRSIPQSSSDTPRAGTERA
jgi:hypothetical protein